MPYATVNDVQTRFGRTLTTSETEQVTAWLGDIEAEILHRVPDLAQRITDGNLSTEVVKRVEANAIVRVLKNPGSLRQRQFSVDDYSESATLDTSISAGALYLTDEEWNLLAPGSSGDAFSFRPFYMAARDGEWVTTDTWVPAP